MPRFSIVVPTRNRSDLVPNAILSILDQSFADFEILLSDNSDPEYRGNVEAAIGSALNDPRLTLIRPPHPMSMTDHWEWAVAHAKGDYVGMLSDRMLLRQSTLSVVNTFIATDNAPIIAFERANLVEQNGKFSVPPADMTEVVCVTKSANDVIDLFRSFPKPVSL